MNMRSCLTGRRILSILTVLALLLVLLPAKASAAGVPPETGELPAGTGLFPWEEDPDPPEEDPISRGDPPAAEGALSAGEESPEEEPRSGGDPMAWDGQETDGVPEFVPGILPEDNELFYPDYELLGELFADPLPAQCDMREISQTPAKSQGANGLCWAFGAYSALEAHMRLQGMGVHDFSELHMAYSLSDHSGNTEQGSSREPYKGGNRLLAASYLMRGTSLSGTVEESEDPYVKTKLQDRELSISQGMEKIWQVKNILFLTDSRNKASFDVIKRAVLTSGGVGASMYWQGQTTATDGSAVQAFFNDEHDAYCYDWNKDNTGKKPDSITGTNHAVEIAGWDDDYPRENFNEYARPEQNGAWLVKNSWGDHWGENGYVWVSYEDTCFPSNAFCFDGVEAYDPCETVYETDYVSNGTTGYSNYSEFYIAKVFSKETDGEEALNAVRVFMGTPYLSVQVGYMPDFSPEALKSFQFTALGELDGNPEAETFYPGWYTIDLDGTARLSGRKGALFAVVIRIRAVSSDSGGRGIYLGYDKINSVDPERLYYSRNGSGWSNLYARNYCIKAAAKPVDPQAQGQVAADRAARDLFWHRIRGENQLETDVREKLDLPDAFKGASLTWTSGSPELIAPDGTVTLPRFDKDNTVALTAAAERNGAVSERTFTLTVPHREATDEDQYQAYRDLQTGKSWWELIKGENRAASQVRSDLVIPKEIPVTTGNGVSYTLEVRSNAVTRNTETMQIPWEYVDEYGHVTRPAYGQQDAKGSFWLYVKNGTAYSPLRAWTLTVPSWKGVLRAADLPDVTGALGGSTVLQAEASAEGSPGALTYRWYQADSREKANPQRIPGAESARYLLPGNLNAGETYYYYCEISGEDAAPVQTNAAAVTTDARRAAHADGSDPRTVRLVNVGVPEGTRVPAAFYGAGGRLERVLWGRVESGGTVAFPGSVTAGGRLFFLDDRYRPLCASLVIS